MHVAGGGLMPYEIVTDAARELVEVRYVGLVTLEHRTDAVRDGVQVLADTGYRRVLVDFRASHGAHQSIERLRAFVARVAAEPLLRESRLAYVAARGKLINDAFEVLADARHFRFRRFHHRDAAVDWLCGPD